MQRIQAGRRLLDGLCSPQVSAWRSGLSDAAALTAGVPHTYAVVDPGATACPQKRWVHISAPAEDNPSRELQTYTPDSPPFPPIANAAQLAQVQLGAPSLLNLSADLTDALEAATAGALAKMGPDAQQHAAAAAELVLRLSDIVTHQGDQFGHQHALMALERLEMVFDAGHVTVQDASDAAEELVDSLSSVVLENAEEFGASGILQLFKVCMKLKVNPLDGRLLDMLASRAVATETLAEFTAPQLAELLHTAVNGLRFAPLDSRFYPSLIGAAARLGDRLDAHSLCGVLAAAASLTGSGMKMSHEVLKVLAQLTVPHKDALRYPELVGVAQSIVSLGQAVAGQPLLATLARRIEDLKTAPPALLSCQAAALEQARHYPGLPWFKAAADRLLSLAASPAGVPAAAVVLNCMAHFAYKPEPALVGQVAKAVLGAPNQVAPNSLCAFAWSLAFYDALTPEAMQAILASVMPRLDALQQRSRVLLGEALTYLLLTQALKQGRDVTVSGTEHDVRFNGNEQVLASRCLADAQCSRFYTAQPFSAGLGALEPSSQAMVDDMAAAVRQLGWPLLHDETVDRAGVRGMDLALEWAEPESAAGRAPPHRVAVVLVQDHHFTLSSPPRRLGRAWLRQRLLALEGWQVVALPASRWRALCTLQEKMAYLSENMMRQVAPKRSAALEALAA